MTEPPNGLKSKDGKVKVVGTSDADEVVISFQWRGKLDRAKNPPQPVTVPVVDGVFRDTFHLPQGRWYVSIAAANGGGVPALEQIKVTSLSDKMTLKIEAIDGGTRIYLTDADGEPIVERKRLDPGERWVKRVDPEVILRVGNARAAHVTVDGQEYGAMGNKLETKTFRIKQGQKPKRID